MFQPPNCQARQSLSNREVPAVLLQEQDQD
jgi:hypothetical protein